MNLTKLNMETNLIIAKDKDQMFKSACKTSLIKYELVEDRAEDLCYVYKVEFNYANDLYHLGFLVGLEKGAEIIKHAYSLKEIY